MSKRFLVILLLMLVYGFATLTAQVLHAGIAVAGGNASGTGGSVSYSVGQLFCTTAFGATGSVSEGVQQPFEISVLSGVEDITGIDLYYAVYPNPTNGKLTLNVKNYEPNTFTYQLYDVNGKILRTDRLIENETIIEMSDLISSPYFLKVTKNNKEVKLFKVIKN